MVCLMILEETQHAWTYNVGGLPTVTAVANRWLNVMPTILAATCLWSREEDY
ncbi:hypothetical protein SPH9361_04629 [Sphingobium sp. CECT 9361]|nr:hypothetical protein SPH9361_04629 [Sphingobium sp. CECT 9361]